MKLRVCAVKVVNIARTTSRNAWAANIAVEWLPYSNIWENKFSQKSELKVKFKNPSSSLGTFCTPI